MDPPYGGLKYHTPDTIPLSPDPKYHTPDTMFDIWIRVLRVDLFEFIKWVVVVIWDLKLIIIKEEELYLLAEVNHIQSVAVSLRPLGNGERQS